MVVPKILKNPLFIIAIITWIYFLLPFLAPVSFKYGNENLGKDINELYANFCHQRVERSIFLFSKDSPIRFYSVSELKEADAIPQVNLNPNSYVWPEYFGHGYVGNEDVGYKVPICIRDVALYGSFALCMTILSFLSKKKIKKLSQMNLYLIGLLLVLPMIIDGLLQTVFEWLVIKSVPLEYINSISKRIITGGLFGLGFSLIIIKLLNPSSLTKKEEKGKI